MAALQPAAHVPARHDGGDDDDEADQVHDENDVVVVLVEEEGGQTDRDLERLLTVRVTELLVVGLGLFVGQGLVRLGHVHEHLS